MSAGEQPIEPRIQNVDALLSTGNVRGRRAVLEMLEAGLQDGDPYWNTRRLVRIEGDSLVVGGSEFEPAGCPRTGAEVYELSGIGRIYVFGAAKGVQRVAKALEDALGDRLTGGHVIEKKGHPVILTRIEVTLGAHPSPDEDCARGCRRILELAKGLTRRDLVFTIAGSGVSSLLTLPAPGITMDDLRKTTYATQIERGMTTSDLNPVRCHLDMVKGGRISRYLHPARMVHILSIQPGSYDQLMRRNSFIHTMPEGTTFATAVANLKKWDAWNVVPQSVRRHLERAEPQHETVKAEEFERMDFRVFGVMPRRASVSPAALEKARQLGFRPVVLAQGLSEIEARDAGVYLAAVARTVERIGQPFEPPCALFSNGEMVVTVGAETGIGGRNQEFVLSAARRIAGSPNIVIGSVDTDGTDGPGGQFVEGKWEIPTLAGGIVDGETVAAARAAGVNIDEELKRHNTLEPLWRTNSGLVVSPNISCLDLTVAVVMGAERQP